MAFVPSITSTQPAGSPSIVTLTDASTGTDGAITQRRAYLRTSKGTFLVPTGTSTEYVQWVLANLSINIDALDKDYGLTIVTQWLDVSNNILYTFTLVQGYTSFNEDYDYGLTELLTGNPDLADDNGFREHKSNLRDFIDSGDQAILRAADTYNAQLCYDLATELRINSQYVFNVDNNQ